MRRRAEGRGGAGRTNLVRDCREWRSSKQALGRLPLPPSVVVFPSSRARPGPALPSFFSVQGEERRGEGKRSWIRALAT